jgi:hypothetical protein
VKPRIRNYAGHGIERKEGKEEEEEEEREERGYMGYEQELLGRTDHFFFRREQIA